MKILLIVIPLIGAGSAWLITTLLFKMMFWPCEPVKLPFGIVVRGLLPQKRDELSAGIREIVETEFQVAITGESRFGTDILERLTDTIAIAAREHVYQRTPVFVPRAVKIKVVELVEDFIRREMPGYAHSLTESMQSQDFRNDICSWAQAKIDSYDLAELEYRLNRSRQVFYVKAATVAIGVVSGLLQLSVIWAASG